MPLLPIDLQTLFSQATQVGKEQSAQKELVPNAQAVQGSHMVRQTDERDKKVNEAQRQEDGAEQVRRKNRRENRGKRKPSEKGEKKPPASKKDVFRDPALGSHIDVTG